MWSDAEESSDSILDAAAGGSEAAMAELFALTNPGLMRFLRATEPRHADDLAGDTWIGVATNLHQFHGDLGGFRAWVFTIARRRIIDHRRRAMRRPTDIVDPHDLLELPDSSTTDQTALDDLAHTDAVRFVAENLSPEQTEVVLLRTVGDLTADEIAEVMGRTSNWVRVTTHRALRKLGDRIGTRLDVTR